MAHVREEVRLGLLGHLGLSLRNLDLLDGFVKLIGRAPETLRHRVEAFVNLGNFRRSVLFQKIVIASLRDRIHSLRQSLESLGEPASHEDE